MSKPIVSVIIAVYNPGKAICRMIDSVLAQSFQDFELIAVDDGSSDNSVEILEQYANKDKRIRVVHQANKGQNEARNVGIALSSGKYVYVCDHDDALHPQALEYCVWCMTRYDVKFLSVDMVFDRGDGPVPVEPLGDFEQYTRMVVDASDKKTYDRDFGQAVHSLRLDCWSHFLDGEMARKIRYQGPYDGSHTWKYIESSTRWMISSARLYFYSYATNGCMTLKLLSESWIRAIGDDMIRFARMYEELQASRKQWDVVRKHFVAKNIKMLVNSESRDRKRRDEDSKNRVRSALANMLRQMFEFGCIKFGDVRLDKYLYYKWLAYRY